MTHMSGLFFFFFLYFFEKLFYFLVRPSWVGLLLSWKPFLIVSDPRSLISCAVDLFYPVAHHSMTDWTAFRASTKCYNDSVARWLFFSSLSGNNGGIICVQWRLKKKQKSRSLQEIHGSSSDSTVLTWGDRTFIFHKPKQSWACFRFVSLLPNYQLTSATSWVLHRGWRGWKQRGRGWKKRRSREVSVKQPQASVPVHHGPVSLRSHTAE